MRAVNLLPPDLRGASKTTAELSVASEASGGAGPFVVLGVLAACVVAATGYVLVGNTVKQRQTELADITARQKAIAGQVAALKPYADFDSKAKARVQTVKDLAGSRFDWAQALGDVARVIPGNVTLKTLTGDTSSGAASSDVQLRTAIASPAITLTGCAPGQTDVARLMARLHGVDGVTRVSLSKSDNSDVATGDTASGTALARRNAQPCGPGIHPSFEIVAFFEHASAAVSAPPASSAAAAATPTPTATPSGSSATTTSSEGTTP